MYFVKRSEPVLESEALDSLSIPVRKESSKTNLEKGMILCEGFCCAAVFTMSSCIPTSRLIHNGGYIQKLLQLFNLPEIL